MQYSIFLSISQLWSSPIIISLCSPKLTPGWTLDQDLSFAFPASKSHARSGSQPEMMFFQTGSSTRHEPFFA
jgi:hypothetical protein